MRFRFQPLRTAQAVACLLNLADGKLELFVLEALLYLADRQALIETGEPITGASLWNTSSGPHCDFGYDWPDKRFFQIEENLTTCISDPGDSELSDYQVKLLTSTLEGVEPDRRTDWRMYYGLISLPEYICPAGGPIPLDPADVLRASGMIEEDIAILEERNRYMEIVDSILNA